MKSMNKIEKLAKRIRFRPDDLMDERILNAAESAMQGSLASESKLAMVTSVAIGRVIKFAAAAVVVFGISLMISVKNQPGKKSTVIITTTVVRSHLDYIKVGALNRAYKDGGLEGLEENYRKAFQGSDSRTEPLTTKQLLAEFNANGKSSGREKL